MNANNMSDEELDNLFRKSAEKYDPPFDEEAWQAMNKRLDHEQGLSAGIKRFLPGLTLALLVTMVFIWKEHKETKPAAVTIQESRTEYRSGLDENNQLLNKVENTAVPETQANTTQHPGVKAGSGTAAVKFNKWAAKPAVATAALSPNPAPDAMLQPRSALLTEPETTTAELLKHRYTTLASAAIHQVPLQEVKAASSADSGKRETPKQPVFLRSATISLVVAPDITTVRFRNPEAVSTNAGLLISLPLTERLSLVSGAVWAKKLYNATPREYAPYPDFWAGKPVPDVITADCKVLDIPVNLQYQVLQRNKHMLTVQAGLSSYMMLNEKYTYTYKHVGKDPYSKTKEFSGENQHWFGVQNLSVGYTRKLSPVFFVGAEPFIKIPLADIGEGNVKLTSAGVFFTAGFTLHQNH